MKTAPVSMIVTVHNRGDLLQRTMAHLLDPERDLTIPDDIIVVDDGSDPEHTEMMRKIHIVGQNPRRQYDGPPNLRYIRTEHPGSTTPCHARNVGLKAAKFDQILTVEPEVLFLTDVVGELMAARTEFTQDCLFGSTWHSKYEDAPILDCTHSNFPYYLLMHRNWLFNVGGWDEGMPGPWGWDDIDLEGRLRRTGHGPRLVPTAQALHLWHPTRVEPAVANERYVRGKEFPRDLQANREVTWGVPIQSS